MPRPNVEPTSSKTDLMYEITYNPQFAPERSSKANVKTLQVGGKQTYIMKNHNTGMIYDIDEYAYGTWNLIDGKRTVAEITEETLKKWPDIDPDTAERVILFCAQAGLLKSVVERPPERRIKIPSAFEVQVALIMKSKNFLEATHKILRPLLRMSLLWVCTAFIILCCVLFAPQFTAIFEDAESFRVLGSTLVGFFFYSFVVLGPAIAIHEIAHGLALVHFGGEPGEIGTGLFYFSPMFYIEASDAWTLGRKQRILVMMAGNISTLLIGSAIVAGGLIIQYPPSISHLLYMTAFFCFYTTLFNMAPPFETDGYYVLADLLNIPNLRQDSYGYVWSLFKKTLGMKVDKENLMVEKKRTLIGFAVLSVAWIVYTAYQTTLFTFYMIGDAQTALVTIYSSIVSSQVASVAAIVVSVASVLYLGMTLAGYGIILKSAVKKAMRTPLKFEAIHDRDLSVFFFLPTEADSVAKDFENRVEKVAGKITQNYEVTKGGLVFTAVLRIGATQLALSQIATHLRDIEQSFSSMYQDFVQENKEDILEQTDTYSSKIELASLLRKMGNEIAVAGMPEAKNIVEQIIDKQEKNAIYLLNSTYGSIWTIELPPDLLYEVQEKLLPTFFVEDFAITDLYAETEEFKKRIVYGFDSLSTLSAQNRKCLREATKHPEEHQVVSCFEPIKSRLLFVGRTERIEKDIRRFGSLLIGQAWVGYLDNLLSETNLVLSTLRHPPLPSTNELEAMREGELFVLSENLRKISECKKNVKTALDKAEELTAQVDKNIEDLKMHFERNEPYKIEFLDALFSINSENLSRVPGRLRRLRREFQRISTAIDEATAKLRAEYLKKTKGAKEEKRRFTYAYALITSLSAVLILAGLLAGTELMSIPFFAVAASMQIVYWLFYYSKWKRRNRAGSYPSSPFINLQTYGLAFTQAIYGFLATYDAVTPTKD